MFQRELMQAENYFVYKERLTATELFDIWWSGDWNHEDVFISQEENSAPESMYFLPETLGRIRMSAKRDLLFQIYRPSDKMMGPVEAVCGNCERFMPLYVKRGDQFHTFKHGYCLYGKEEDLEVYPGDRPRDEKCFVLNGIFKVE